MKSRLIVAAAVLAASFLAVGCSTYKDTDADPAVQASREAEMSGKVQNAIGDFRANDPSIHKFFDDAYGYAVFPKIGKGGAGLGGAYGKGQVIEQGTTVGNVSMSQATIGFQLGGQTYSEIIFFQTAQKLNDFKAGNFELSAQASAVAAHDGAASTTDYTEGVAVFVLPIKGLMGEASVGGQKFEYSPLAR
jgi:lipid-binding SYLF domain-containing protein